MQSLTAPNVPLFVRLTPRGLVMAHESTFTLFELGPDASLVHINTLYCCKVRARVYICACLCGSRGLATCCARDSVAVPGDALW